MTLSEGQLIAAKWFGVAPFWWGWIVALIFVVLLVAVTFVRRPSWGRASTSGVSSPSASTLRWWAAGIVLAALVLHAPGLWGHFNMMDDSAQILNNEVTKNLTQENLWKTTFGNYKGTNQELMYLSFQLNWLIAGKKYALWYAVNLAMFVPLLLLTARLASRLTAKPVAGLVAMAVLATTPQMSEMLCWMSVRSHYIGLVLAVACCVAYVEYLNRRTHRWPWLLLALIALVLTQLSKPVFAYLPLWMILFDLYFRRRDWVRAILEKIVMLAIVAAFIYKITVAGVGPKLISKGPLGGTYLNTLLIDLNLLVEYGRTSLFPVQTGMVPPINLAVGPLFVEGVPQVLVNGFAPLASLIILLCVLGIAVVLRVRFRWGVPLLWIWASGVSLATVMNIPNRGVLARFEYRYAMSAQVMSAVLIGALVAVLFHLELFRRPNWRHVPMILCVTYLGWGASQTLQNTAAWNSSYAFYTRNARLYPYGFDANRYAGKIYRARGEHYIAVHHYLMCEQVSDRDSNKHLQPLGDSLYAIGDLVGARRRWRLHYSNHPSDISIHMLDDFEAVGLTPADIGLKAWPIVRFYPDGSIK